MGFRFSTRVLYSLVVVLAILVGFAMWLFWPIGNNVHVDGETSTSILETAMPAPVGAVKVTRSSLSLTAEATGTLQPWRQVEVAVEVSGKVAWHALGEGQQVEAASVLMRLDDTERRIDLAEAEADLLKVRAAYAVSFAIQGGKSLVFHGEGTEDEALSTRYQETRRLFAEGSIAERELNVAQRLFEVGEILKGHHRGEIQAATAGLTQMEQRVERARLALARTSLQAPFSGRVADVNVEVGQQIPAGKSCFLLLDESHVKVSVEVLAADMIWLRQGAPAQVRIPALQDKVFKGRIHSINPRVNPETGTARVSVVIANPKGRLIPGLFAFIRLETRRLSDRLVVPSDAVLLRQERDLVFRLEQGRALWTYVKTGARSEGMVEIVEGLVEEDFVAVTGHFSLAHEAPVDMSILTQEGLLQQKNPPMGGQGAWNI